MSIDFSSLHVEPILIKALEKKNIVEPTDIQKKVIPEVMNGQDVIARAKTGSGKTLAFLLHILQKIDTSNKGIQALILAPTNELAAQIHEVVKDLTTETDITSDLFLGSANINRQIDKLKKAKPQIVVGTPMRVWDLTEKKKLKLHDVRFVVIDEADRMFEEKGAYKTYQQIVSRISKESQHIYVSATITERFQDLISERVPLSVFIEGEDKQNDSNVEHLYVVVEDRERIDFTRRLIPNLQIKKAIVFVNHLDKVSETTQKLQYKGIPAGSLSADQSKVERASVMKGFQEGKVEILVASDLAARGIDIADVMYVINIHPPVDADTYVHRSGRTGRMGKKGTIISLITEKERFIIDKFQKKLSLSMEECVFQRGKLMKKDEQHDVQKKINKNDKSFSNKG